MGGEGGKMTFLEHLEELRRRIIYCVVAVAGGIVVCWIFREEIRAFLEAPLYTAWSRVEGLPPAQPLSFTSLIEPFMAYLKLSAIGGVFLAVPAILYNLWKFIAPGLYKRERKVALPFVFVSSLLFLGGSTLCYAFVFPIGIQFFLEFAAGGTPEEQTVSIVTEPPASIAPAEAEATARAPIAPAEPDGGSADGGVEVASDAGVEEARAPIEAASPDARREVKPAAHEEPSLVDLALEKLLREGCGELTAQADPAGAASLRYTWHEGECGAIPEIMSLKRDGAMVEVGWEKAADAPSGYAVLAARDAPERGGRHEYVLHTLSRGDTGRKLAPILMLSDYLSFSIKLLFAFGILFELPVLVVFLALAGIVDHKQLLKFSRWFIVLALIVGAVMTTPDMITQIMFAGPLIVLYFISVLIAYFIERKRKA
ncbi:MAG: twin-arginine translocase subunit TatC [Proteobacteria bacterium]|jgi:Tat protein translocase TatC|nr:twin-arginine translocase subunit TatC [Pseudomonadota bacterium]